MARRSSSSSSSSIVVHRRLVVSSWETDVALLHRTLPTSRSQTKRRFAVVVVAVVSSSEVWRRCAPLPRAAARKRRVVVVAVVALSFNRCFSAGADFCIVVVLIFLSRLLALRRSLPAHPVEVIRGVPHSAGMGLSRTCPGLALCRFEAALWSFLVHFGAIAASLRAIGCQQDGKKPKSLIT